MLSARPNLFPGTGGCFRRRQLVPLASARQQALNLEHVFWRQGHSIHSDAAPSSSLFIANEVRYGSTADLFAPSAPAISSAVSSNLFAIFFSIALVVASSSKAAAARSALACFRY